MAVELAVGYVSVVPSGRGFGRALTTMGTTAGLAAGTAASNSFGSRFVAGMSSVARRAALAFTAGLGTAGFFAVRTAANFEQTRIAFEGILGDVEKANSLLNELRDFAAKTPFEFTDLTTASKQLLAVGFASEDIIPTMTTLGNVAATLGVGAPEIEGVVRALGQMRGKGKASAEELRQISEQVPGFSAINAIAESLGVTTAEAFALMERGAIDADTGIKAILDGMQRFPGASGAMERQSKTLNGVISTLKDTLAITAIDFVTPYLPALSSGVQAFGGLVQDMAERAKTFLDSEGFANFKETVRTLVSDALEGLSTWWSNNGENVLGFFSGLATIFTDRLLPALKPVGEFMRDTLLPALVSFGDWLVNDGPGAELVITGLAAAFVKYAIGAAAAAAATLAAIWPFALAAVVVGTLSWATTELLERSGPFLQFFIDLFVAVADAAAAVWDLVEGVGELIKKIPDIPDIPIPTGGVPGGGLNPLNWLDKLPFLDHGGVMPGARGVHSLAWVAGGETVLPTHRPDWGGTGALVGGDVNMTLLPTEDPVAALFRELNRVKLLAGVP